MEKTWPAAEYEVGREKIREFVEAVDERRAIYNDRDAACAAGFRDLVAPPMFAVVYSNRPLWTAIGDPELGIDVSRMLHVGQELRFGEPVCSGDVITTEMGLAHVEEGKRRTTYSFESRSRNESGEQTIEATWTMMVIGS